MNVKPAEGRIVLTQSGQSHEFEPKMADHSSAASEHSTEVAKTLVSSNEYLKPHIMESDGHIATSPEESLSPASVIYFKEALTYNSSVQFSKTSSSAAPVRYDFQIEKTKKTRSEYVMWSSSYAVLVFVLPQLSMSTTLQHDSHY